MTDSKRLSISPAHLDSIRQIADEIMVHSERFEPWICQTQTESLSRQNLSAALESLTQTLLTPPPATPETPAKAKVPQPQPVVTKKTLSKPSPAPAPAPKTQMLEALMAAGKHYKSSRLIKGDQLSNEDLGRIRTESHSIPDHLREEQWDQS